MGLLNQLRYNNEKVYGLMSSHLAARLIAAKAFESKRISISIVNSTLKIMAIVNTVRLDFIKERTEEIMKVFSIRYVKDANLHGSLSNPGDASGLVPRGETGF